jgi:hypothetical protein
LLKESENNRPDILYQIAFEFIDVDNKLGLEYAKQAFDAAMKSGDSLWIVKAGRIKSLAFRRLGELDSSLILSFKMLPIAKNHNYVEEQKHILNGLALAYIHKNYDKALNYCFQLLELNKVKYFDYSIILGLSLL